MKANLTNLSRRSFLAGGASSLLLAACAPALKQTALGSPVNVPLPGNKRLKVIFHFGKHATVEDAKEITPILEEFKPHVVCPEGAFATEEKARKWEDDWLNNRFAPADEYGGALAKSLILSRVKRIFLLERFNQAKSDTTRASWGVFINKSSDSDDAFYAGLPEKVLEHYDKAVDAMVKSSVSRELEMKRVLSNFYGQLVQRYPELSKEPEVRVVVNCGGAHTPVFKAARKMGFGEVQRKMKAPYYFSAFLVPMRMATFGKQRKRDKDTLAREVLNFHYGNLVSDKTKSSDANTNAFVNLATKKLGFDTLQRVSKAVSSHSNPRSNEAIELALKAEGVPVPQSKAEVHAFLEKKLGPRRFTRD